MIILGPLLRILALVVVVIVVIGDGSGYIIEVSVGYVVVSLIFFFLVRLSLKPLILIFYTLFLL